MTIAPRSHQQNRSLEYLLTVGLGTLYAVFSRVAGGPLLAIGNPFTGYAPMPSMGKIGGDLTLVTTGQTGEANLLSFDLFSSSRWSEAAPDLGKMALGGLGLSAVLAIPIISHRAGKDERARVMGEVRLRDARVRLLRN